MNTINITRQEVVGFNDAQIDAYARMKTAAMVESIFGNQSDIIKQYAQDNTKVIFQ
ncbi:hypothetical protein [Aeromonas veronii]|uniref:hypothetical protein n=1 Tax=Aeromonas veronii TaxID=654 RepID=UPI003004D70E